MKNKLVECAEQEWAEGLPEGSYRFPSRWLEERGSWLKNGVPEKAHMQASFVQISLLFSFYSVVREIKEVGGGV